MTIVVLEIFNPLKKEVIVSKNPREKTFIDIFWMFEEEKIWSKNGILTVKMTTINAASPAMIAIHVPVERSGVLSIAAGLLLIRPITLSVK